MMRQKSEQKFVFYLKNMYMSIEILFILWIFVRAFTKASKAFSFFFFFDISVLREYHDASCKCVSLSMKIPSF